MNVKHFIKTCGMFVVMATALTACSDDDCDLRHSDSLLGLPALKEGTFPESGVQLNVGETYDYAPRVTSSGDVYYQWYMNEEDMGTEPRFSFTAERPSRSLVVLELTNDFGKVILQNKLVVPGADYTGGCLIINEGWFGHETGSVSYYDYRSNAVETRALRNQNFGASLGTTSQSATLWNGKLYICSKQGNQLTVVDPKTLYIEKSAPVLAGTRQVYEFIGLSDKYGVVTANGDVFRVDLETFASEQIVMDDTWGGCGSASVYRGKLLLNVKSKKMHVLEVERILNDDLSQYTFSNSFPYTTIDVTTTGGCRFVAGKDGNIYTVESAKSGNNLVKIKPDLSVEKVPVRSDYEPSSFGAYREDSFCGDGENFFYLAGGKIYKSTFENAAPEQPFTSYEKEGYGFYGAGIRVNPTTKEVLATYLTEDYQKNLIVRFNGTTGEKISEVMFDGYYFPGTIIFNEQ